MGCDRWTIINFVCDYGAFEPNLGISLDTWFLLDVEKELKKKSADLYHSFDN